MKVETSLREKLSQLSFSPTTTESDFSFPPQLFFNWSTSDSTSSAEERDGPGFYSAVLTTDSAFLIQTINDEFLYLLNYQEEDLIAKNAMSVLMNLKECSEGVTLAELKKKDGSTVIGFLKIGERKGGRIINFQALPMEFCVFKIESSNQVHILEKSCAFDLNDQESLSLESLPCFNAKEHLQFVSLRSSPARIRKDSESVFRIEVFPSIGGLIIARREDLSVVDVNNDFISLLTGYNKNEVVGKDLLHLLPNLNDLITTMDWFPVNSSSHCSTFFCSRKAFPLNLSHKDGGIINVMAQCRYFGDNEKMLALWIGYERTRTPDLEKKEGNIFSPTLLLGRKKSYLGQLSTLVPNLNKHNFPASIKGNEEKLTISDFEEVKSLGEGAFSFIKLCTHEGDPLKTPVVIKYVVRSRILTWSREKPELGPRIPVELAVLDDLRKNPQKHILAIQAHFSDEYYYCLLFNHYPAFDLFELLEKKKELSLTEIKSILKQTCSAIHHLHDMGICHRDIKDENVLIDDAGNITLIDFGSANYVAKGPFTTFYGTKLFCAPEVLAGAAYEGRPQDIWQLGCLAFILFFRQNPFYSEDDILLFNLQFPAPLEDPHLKDIFLLLFHRDEKTRLTACEFLEHQWLK